MNEYKRNLFHPSRLNLIILLSLVCGCCAFNIEEETLDVSDLFLSTTKISTFTVLFLGLHTLYEWVFYIKTMLRSIEGVQEDNRTAVVENDEPRTLTAIKDADKRAVTTITDFIADEPVKGQSAETDSYVKEQVTSMDTYLKMMAAENDAFIRREALHNFSCLTKKAAKNDIFIRMQIARRCGYLKKQANKNFDFIKCQGGY
ncbi:hypothetical protein TNIN_326841 [Trichonephila inaurata madagascariensis]|uniref:Lipoprotein n=1 Tax=Trichonephila inaurata madagascariensis TaxID=2747483 RepID=A0A8X7C369_9ARAC|nr:hypothetical protein TNIN_326841 [Trichonephila inaurata madagascariensis]